MFAGSASALAYRGIPLQSAYCAAKHAIVVFWTSLRRNCGTTGSTSPLTECAPARRQHAPVSTGRAPAAALAAPSGPIYQPEAAAEPFVPMRSGPYLLRGSGRHPHRDHDALSPSLADRYLAATPSPGRLRPGRARSARSPPQGIDARRRRDNAPDPRLLLARRAGLRLRLPVYADVASEPVSRYGGRRWRGGLGARRATAAVIRRACNSPRLSGLSRLRRPSNHLMDGGWQRRRPVVSGYTFAIARRDDRFRLMSSSFGACFADLGHDGGLRRQGPRRSPRWRRGRDADLRAGALRISCAAILEQSRLASRRRCEQAVSEAEAVFYRGGHALAARRRARGPLLRRRPAAGEIASP